MSESLAGGSRSSVAWALLIAAFLLTIGYWVAFFAESFAGQIPRTQVLWLLLVVDQWPLAWVAGAWENGRVLDRGAVFALAGLILLAGWSAGEVLLQVLRIPIQGALRFVGALGAGLAVLSWLLAVWGMAGGLQFRWLAWFIMFAVLALPWCGAESRQRIWRGFARRKRNWAQPGVRMYGMLALPLVVILLFAAALPPIEFDVLEYHLQAPKEWLEQGRITALPHNVYANMPLGSEMLVLWGMVLMPGELSWWWGALAGKVVLASYAVLTAGLLFAQARRWLGRGRAAAAALMYLATPWVLNVSINGLVDGVLAYYVTATLLIILSATRGQSKPTQDGTTRYLILAGVMAGAAMSCKYTGAIYAFVPGVIGIWMWRRQAAWKPLLLYTAAAAIVVAPWLAKNAVALGNPVYPLLNTWTGQTTMTGEQNERWKQAHQVPRDAEGRRYSFPQLKQSLQQLAYRSPWLNPALMPWLLIGLTSRRPPGRLWLKMAAWLFVSLSFWWVATHRIDRFWIPMLPLATLWVAGVGKPRRIPGDAIWTGCLVALATLYSLLLLGFGLMGDNRLLTSLELLRSDQEISYRLPIHQYLNRNVGEGERVLLVGDARPFHLECDYLYSTCFDTSQFDQLVSLPDKAARLAYLQQLGVTHVLFDWNEIRRYRNSYGISQNFRETLVEQWVADGLFVPVDLPPDLAESYRLYELADSMSVAIRDPQVRFVAEMCPVIQYTRRPAHSTNRFGRWRDSGTRYRETIKELAFRDNDRAQWALPQQRN